MKKIIYSLISLILMITLCGCKNNNQDGLYQLPNQSYSQMMSYIIEDKGHTIVTRLLLMVEQQKIVNIYFLK